MKQTSVTARRPRNSNDQIEARREQSARESGKALPHYARKVASEMSHKRKRGALTPSKRA